MNLKNISNQLAEKLETIPEIHSVYRCEPNNPSGYPFAVVLPAPSRSETLDSCSNSVFLAFRVSIIDNFSDNDEGRQEVEDRMMDISASVISILSMKNSFSGVMRAELKNIEPKYQERENGTARIYEFPIEFQTIHSIL